MSLRPDTSKSRTQQKAPAKLAMKCAIGKNCFHVFRTHALGSWAVRERLLRGLSLARAEGLKSKLAMKDSIG
jgi:hypothetical protein